MAMEMYDKVAKASPVKQDGPHGWIQWKGTNVCVDLHCSCGEQSHVDDDFVYSFRCRCGKLWGLDPSITLVPLDDADVVGCCEPRMDMSEPEEP